MDDIYTNQEVGSLAKFIFTFQVFATMSLQKGTPAKISQTGVQNTPSSVKERKLESNIFGSTTNNDANWNFEPVHTPTKEGEIRHSKEEKDKQVQCLLKLWKMSSGTQP
ncbi:hypothetical protein H5410_043938 [Solanum commersonii]|uniref:Uncharacterized protein n=1 Tax=Solanum commersonii TaxID=4109 RepID=A0A9J5Y1L9_SOLCO|nr:hypothetical protein H5410_043938 [Solanum commersonii]